MINFNPANSSVRSKYDNKCIKQNVNFGAVTLVNQVYRHTGTETVKILKNHCYETFSDETILSEAMFSVQKSIINFFNSNKVDKKIQNLFKSLYLKDNQQNGAYNWIYNGRGYLITGKEAQEFRKILNEKNKVLAYYDIHKQYSKKDDHLVQINKYYEEKVNKTIIEPNISEAKSISIFGKYNEGDNCFNVKKIQVSKPELLVC